ncbi:MAG: MbcA/ParS/Xre antitoxin family protein [Bryobacteraceae bacterium]|nr:MbcA/ParS/Xre antitoxin family protein [Bryobacteraceae bacterium]
MSAPLAKSVRRKPVAVSREQSDLFAEIVNVFGSQAKANRWNHTPSEVFGGRTPADLTDSVEGRQAVRDQLTRIQHGIPW